MIQNSLFCCCVVTLNCILFAREIGNLEHLLHRADTQMIITGVCIESKGLVVIRVSHKCLRND